MALVSQSGNRSLNSPSEAIVLLPNRPRTAHNWTVTDGGNVVKNLFVGNLGSEVTPEELRRLFEAYGQVVQVHIIVDRDTGLPRGFAFVEMTNDAEAEKAIKALNGSILRDRTLDVNYARPRPERFLTVRANVSGPAPESWVFSANCGRSLSFAIDRWRGVCCAVIQVEAKLELSRIRHQAGMPRRIEHDFNMNFRDTGQPRELALHVGL